MVKNKKSFLKTILPLLAVVLVGGMVITSCEEEKNTNNIPNILDITHTQCDANAEKSSHSDSIVVNYSNGVVDIAHYNLTVPCDFANIRVRVSTNLDTIRISEISDGGYVDCICFIDNFFRINNIKGMRTIVIENCNPPYCQTFNI